MGLFDKKYCDLCGNKIGLLGNKKLADGNMCGECQKKLSRWFSDRRESTVAQIREQMAYREANAAMLADFRPSRQIGTGDDKFILVDEHMGRFVVLRGGEDMKKNPDLLELARVRNVRMEIAEDTSEVRYKNAEGSMVSYDPKHYSYKYRFIMTIDYDGPFFQEIRFQMNNLSVNGGTDGEQYRGMMMGENFRGQMGLHGAQPRNVMRSGRFGNRQDLPGGYRTDGLTTMSDIDIQRYQEYEALGDEIIQYLKGGGAQPADVPAAAATDLNELKNRAFQLSREGREEEAAQLFRQLADAGDSDCAQIYLLSLENRALNAQKSGDDATAIALMKEAIERGEPDYTELLLAMQRKAMSASGTAEDARDLLEWANRAKAAGQDADLFISFANTSLQAKSMGVGAGAPLEQQYAASIAASMATAMEQAGSPEKAAELRAAYAAQQGAPAPAAAAAPAAASWVCGCGATNTGRFCEYCGSPRP